MPWLELQLSSSQPEWVEEVLTAQGAHAVSLQDAGDAPILEPAPGATPLWRDTRVRALFSHDVDWTRVRAALSESLAPELWRDWEVLSIDDHDWVRAWQAQESPRRFGRRLWVCPTHAQVDLAAGEALVLLDAGLGFGTGAHPTTALCLEWLAQADLGGRRVLDYGCGSGILAIAALRLGAAEAVAIDIDAQALIATRDNAERNGVTDRLQVASAAQEPPPLGEFRRGARQYLGASIGGACAAPDARCGDEGVAGVDRHSARAGIHSAHGVCVTGRAVAGAMRGRVGGADRTLRLIARVSFFAPTKRL